MVFMFLFFFKKKRVLWESRGLTYRKALASAVFLAKLRQNAAVLPLRFANFIVNPLNAKKQKRNIDLLWVTCLSGKK